MILVLKEEVLGWTNVPHQYSEDAHEATSFENRSVSATVSSGSLIAASLPMESERSLQSIS